MPKIVLVGTSMTIFIAATIAFLKCKYTNRNIKIIQNAVKVKNKNEQCPNSRQKGVYQHAIKIPLIAKPDTDINQLAMMVHPGYAHSTL